MAPASHSELSHCMVELLSQLISIPSISREETGTASLLSDFLKKKGIEVLRKGNNIWAKNKFFDAAKPTLLLNSHHDTVNPNAGYNRNPYEPEIADGKLFGLGSNDAGASLVSLLGTFLHFYEQTELPFSLIYAATAEEEISGGGGIESIIKELTPVHLAIVGEPTQMKIAVAERGLLVLDAVAKGKAGHAARNEGENAIYIAMKDIDWFRTYKFHKTSQWLGSVSMNVTAINAGNAHNQVPAQCNFVIDIRMNEYYTHQEIIETIKQHIKSEIKERSTRIKPTFVDMSHNIVTAAKKLNIPFYGSPTTSDMALMPWQAIKMGPGDSARSHSADEFVYVHEVESGIKNYIELLQNYIAVLKSNA